MPIKSVNSNYPFGLGTGYTLLAVEYELCLQSAHDVQYINFIP